ncbi:MAG TPA: NAD(P)-dependent oxidoreductase [Acetobacteraceae bacterium]|jgi:3-hydroxyisobutyrate dehydrogenase|nr:NAD(P)-dependent oxidoreductase [Acetobacteraceae bacterium]
MIQLAWIGLGRIGAPMALRLLAAGYRLNVFDVVPEAMDPLVAAGARAATSPGDAAAEAHVVCFCVSDGEAVERAAFGVDGVASRAPKGALLIDHSTTHPELTRTISARAEAMGFCWVDAPISGGISAAKNGTLAAWLGGRREHADRAQTVVATYAGRINYMGPSGNGQTAKSCNQVIVANTIAIWAEMLAYAAGNGLDLETLIDTLEGSGADSGVRRTFAKGMANGTFPDLSTRNMIKDLGIIEDLANQAGVPMPISSIALERFKRGIARLGG